jgi:pyruvate dehydrogenase E1 component alpha subunit
MPGVTIDGNDPVAVMEAVAEAANKARSGEGPTLVECITHRLQGHTFGLPSDYMDQQALKAAWDADPVPRFRTRLLESGLFDQSDLDAIDTEAAALVEDALQFALSSPEPPLEELYVDVFANEEDVIR